MYNRRAHYIPIAHTCFNTLELSDESPTQDVFNANIKTFLEYALAGDGFQFA